MIAVKLTLMLILSQSATEPTVTLVFGLNEPSVTMTVAEAQKRLETETDPKWQVALVLALGTKNGCSVGQVDAGLCLPEMCITREQHIAEVTSWWAAPEREYIKCPEKTQ